MRLCMKMSPRMVETERVPLRRLAQITGHDGVPEGTPYGGR